MATGLSAHKVTLNELAWSMLYDEFKEDNDEQAVAQFAAHRRSGTLRTVILDERVFEASKAYCRLWIDDEDLCLQQAISEGKASRHSKLAAKRGLERLQSCS